MMRYTATILQQQKKLRWHNISLHICLWNIYYIYIYICIYGNKYALYCCDFSSQIRVKNNIHVKGVAWWENLIMAYNRLPSLVIMGDELRAPLKSLNTIECCNIQGISAGTLIRTSLCREPWVSRTTTRPIAGSQKSTDIASNVSVTPEYLPVYLSPVFPCRGLENITTIEINELININKWAYLVAKILFIHMDTLKISKLFMQRMENSFSTYFFWLCITFTLLVIFNSSYI